MIDKILGDSLALAARALYCSHSIEPENGALLRLATAEAYEKGLDRPTLLEEGSKAPRCWWPPGALGVGSHDPCLSRESWWICCWPRRRPHRIWLSHFWALGPELSLDDFEGLCPSWLKVISERSQLGCGGGAPHGCGNFHKDSGLQLECESLAADTRQSMCSQWTETLFAFGAVVLLGFSVEQKSKKHR